LVKNIFNYMSKLYYRYVSVHVRVIDRGQSDIRLYINLAQIINNFGGVLNTDASGKLIN
jgi:hypothetical protein